MPPRVVSSLLAIASHDGDQCRAVRFLKSGTALDFGDVTAPDDAPANGCHLAHARGAPPCYASSFLTTVPADVGQAEFAALELVGELRVVESHQVQDRGVEVVDFDGIFDDVVAEIVGPAERDARLDAAAGHPDR